MHTLTDEDLQRVPQQLLAGARRGEMTVVTTDGRPVLLAVPPADGVPMRSALVDLAAALFDRDEISLGTAARIAGMGYSEMIDELGRREIATIRITPEELGRELAAWGAETLVIEAPDNNLVPASAIIVVSDAGPLIALRRLDLIG